MVCVSAHCIERGGSSVVVQCSFVAGKIDTSRAVRPPEHARATLVEDPFGASFLRQELLVKLQADIVIVLYICN